MHFFAGVTQENAKGEAVLDAINGIPVTLHPPSPILFLNPKPDLRPVPASISGAITKAKQRLRDLGKYKMYRMNKAWLSGGKRRSNKFCPL